MTNIIRKELADYFTSIRCFILFLLVVIASAVALYAAHQGIRGVSTESGFIFTGLFTTGTNIPSLITFIALLVPSSASPSASTLSTANAPTAP
jgi:hypothetical protein